MRGLEFFYRDLVPGNQRIVGPFDSVNEARLSARYKGIPKVEILTKKGADYVPIEAETAAAARKTA